MIEHRPELTVAFAHRTTWETFQHADVRGVPLEVVTDGTAPSNQVYTLLAGTHDYDVGELAFSTYFMTQDLGSQDIALPIFPSRMVPHAGAWVHEHSGIREPRDLVDRRVGCNSFGTNYSVWLRGILAHQYDVPVQRITWVQSVEEHRSDFQRPARFAIEVIPGNVRSEVLLAEGRIDAASMASGAGGPRSGSVRELFADAHAELRAYADGFGVVPINTVMTMRRSTVGRNPALPRLLFDAMVAARVKQQAAAPNAEDAIFQPLERDLGRSLTSYGFGANRPAIREMIAYCYEQGIIRRLYQPEELFLLTDT
jgi:4,5-dihydroxyphthalate decarboxylase